MKSLRIRDGNSELICQLAVVMVLIVFVWVLH